MHTLSRLAIAAAMGLGSAANAAVVVDKSPDVTGFVPNFSAQNIATQQNFLSSFTLASATTLNGASIYSACRAQGCVAPNLGTAIVIKFRSDVGNQPGPANLFTFNSTVSAIDSSGSAADPSIERFFSAFTPTAFAAGTYWFGLSGVNEIGLNLDSTRPSAGLWSLTNDTLLNDVSGISTAFQLESAVPEPASWALMIGGFAMTGLAMRRRKVALAV